jgi:hypothetical protein
MRKNVALIIIVLLALSGCNLPLESTSVSPTVDVLGTQVAQRLTSTASVIQPVSTTAVPVPTSTELPTLVVTDTPAATLTPSLTAEASTTPTITRTPVASPTVTFTPTSTGIPGDPVNDLGQPDWKDSFQKASTWGLQSPYDDGHTRVSVVPGKLVLMSYDSNGWRGWRMMNTSIKDFYLETTIQTQTCSGSDLYGIIFRSTTNAKGYWLTITCDGHYSLDVGDINNSDPVIESKSSNLIKAGSNQTNRFGIMAKGDKISFYANGKLVEDVTNDTITNAGAFGYFIAANKTAGFTIEATEIAYWVLP